MSPCATCSPAHPDVVRGHSTDQDQQQQQLLSALQDAELHNQRLRSTLGVMRGEMEALQAAAAAAAAVVVPQDVAVLQAELQV